MHLPRRTFLKAVAVFSAILSGGLHKTSLALAETNEKVSTGGNGLYIQPWFEDSFLDLKEEMMAAMQDGKQLIILYEQAGCPYCKELHKVNLQNPKIKEFMKKHFRVIQLDIRGSREVTDFSGNNMTEKAFAQQWKIHFTPTLSFFPVNGDLVFNKKGRDAEAFRLTGYWKPFHFETVLRFVTSGSYKKDTLQHFLSQRIQHLKKKGEPVKIWD